MDRILVGRMPGVLLGEEGRDQARLLADRFGSGTITAVRSSPRERACETAGFISARAGVPVEIAPELDEIDVGEWTGCSFDVLSADARWNRWNAARADARPPGGESMRELQSRVLDYLQRLHAAQPGARLVLVTHAEVIRAALLHYLGLSLNAFGSVEVQPAAVSTLYVSDTRAQVVALNER
jgi:probable phosphoglycerate mutase